MGSTGHPIINEKKKTVKKKNRSKKWVSNAVPQPLGKHWGNPAQCMSMWTPTGVTGKPNYSVSSLPGGAKNSQRRPNLGLPVSGGKLALLASSTAQARRGEEGRRVRGEGEEGGRVRGWGGEKEGIEFTSKYRVPVGDAKEKNSWVCDSTAERAAGNKDYCEKGSLRFVLFWKQILLTCCGSFTWWFVSDRSWISQGSNFLCTLRQFQAGLTDLRSEPEKS